MFRSTSAGRLFAGWCPTSVPFAGKQRLLQKVFVSAPACVNQRTMDLLDAHDDASMKKVFIALGVLLLILAAVQAYISSNMAKTETQPYEVLWKQQQVEARYYPSAIMATVHGSSNEYRSSANQHFRVLAGYIFGGNEKKQSIAMTSPVHMTFDGSGSEMSFVMPKGMEMETLPRPNDRGIRFRESGEKYVMALRFGGWPMTAASESIPTNSWPSSVRWASNLSRPLGTWVTIHHFSCSTEGMKWPWRFPKNNFRC
ncbi:MAG: hypothetical protein GC178_00250 [Flavobacteriales bacterium]|nr:hypothetical protein [Flavobacteriales bacterium]